MFQKGVTNAEIADLIEWMYGHHYTPQTISNLTKVMSEQVEAFQVRPLSARYACVYLDATYIALKRETVAKEAKEAVPIAVGIRENGSKDVLGYTIAPTESASVWKEVLQDIQDRGAEEILLFVSDGLKGIADAKYQTCCVHLQRNISHKVRISDRQKICDDFKKVYRADNLENAQKALQDFIKKWKTLYLKVTKPLAANSYILTFYSFPKSIWRSIYSTNLIESFKNKSRNIASVRSNSPSIVRTLSSFTV